MKSHPHQSMFPAGVVLFMERPARVFMLTNTRPAVVRKEEAGIRRQVEAVMAHRQRRTTTAGGGGQQRKKETQPTIVWGIFS